MKKIFWITHSWEQVPGNLNWLHPSELEVYRGFRFEKKQHDWLLGRWTAKQGILGYKKDLIHENQIQDLAILPASNGAPEVFYKGDPLDVQISLSHSNGIGFCAIGESGIKLGCDLEKIETRSKNFIQDYLTPSEISIINNHEEKFTSLLANLIWSAKESVLKALRTGLSIDTRKVQIECLPSNESGIWKTFDIYLPNYDVKLYGKWQLYQGFVYTIVSEHKGFELLEIE